MQIIRGLGQLLYPYPLSLFFYFGNLEQGHDGPVMAMACHSSGGLLATAGADKKVLVWDVDGGFCTHFFRGHGGVVTTVIFHTDPNKLLVIIGPLSFHCLFL